ncbi:MAG: nitroreductase [Nitrospiraceae bacterium]|nr:nitroreductase [Nitrospiraceae bacterium]
MDLLDVIRSRRSVRKFSADPVPEELIEKILEAGRWAPSGLNNQPWRFAVVTNRETVTAISKLTHYSKVVLASQVLIPVFLDTEKSYHREKDIQAIGACLQNMLLEAHSLGLGAVWLGEIIRSGAEIRSLLHLLDSLDLMAVLAIGYPDEQPRPTKRKAPEELLVYKDS